jgi:hypothetical protein
MHLFKLRGRSLHLASVAAALLVAAAVPGPASSRP